MNVDLKERRWLDILMRGTQNRGKDKSQGRAVKSDLVPERTASEIASRGIPDIEGLRHEYTEVNNNIRHYSNLRFAIFTVYFAAMSGLAAVAFGFFEIKAGNPELVKLWGRVGGLLFTALFFRFELRVESLIGVNLEIGEKLESKLGYSQITSRPSTGMFSMPHVTRLFYSTLIIFWLVMLTNLLMTLLA